MLEIICYLAINGTPMQVTGHEVAERGDQILFAYNGQTRLVNSNSCKYTKTSLRKIASQLQQGWQIKGNQPWCVVDEWFEAWCGYSSFEQCLKTLQYDKVGKFCKSRADLEQESVPDESEKPPQKSPHVAN